MLFLILSVSAGMIWSVRSLEQDMERLELAYTRTALARQAESCINRALKEVYDIVVLDEHAIQYVEHVARAADNFDRLTEMAGQALASPGLAVQETMNERVKMEVIAELRQCYEKIVTHSREAVQLARQGHKAQATQLLVDGIEGGFDNRFAVIIAKLISDEEKQVELLRATARRHREFAWTLLWYGVVAGLGATVFFAIRIARSIVNPIHALYDAAVSIGRGDLDTPIRVASDDELGDLAGAFKRMTHSLRESTDRLQREIDQRRRVEDQQAETMARLGAVNAELTDFAYVVSHDLKAPLRGIRTLADWLATDYGDELDEDGKEKLTLLGRRAELMHGLIEGVLQYSRIGRVTEEAAPIDLNTLVAEVIDMLAPPSHIEIVTTNELPTIEADRTRITQIFENLLSNAVKYMDKPHGLIAITCESEGSFWKFSVSDNGPGIEEKYFERVFRIFQTLTSRDEFESTGVGLTLVKKIVELYGGKVWIESEVGQGSTFFFTLPKQTVATEQEQALVVAADSSESQGEQLRNET
jgi:signal transduction histidine kinase